MIESRPMKKIYDLANLVILILITYTVSTGYAKLPERIPTHFNFAGQPDRWGGRSSFIVLAGVAWGMAILFYALIRYLPRMGRNPKNLNIPHKEQFLRLPEEKKMLYWALLAEFLAATVAATNLLFYLIIRGIMRIASGEATLLSFQEVLPAIVALGLVILVYLWKLLVMPGRLVRGEE